jgi:hypothetical protein
MLALVPLVLAALLTARQTIEAFLKASKHVSGMANRSGPSGERCSERLSSHLEMLCHNLKNSTAAACCWKAEPVLSLTSAATMQDWTSKGPSFVRIGGLGHSRS